MAQLNAGIILQGQQPNVMRAMAQGAAAGHQMNQIQRQNALTQLYQDQGAQIMAGDQNALNALAGHDPKAALGIMDARQGMDARGLQMDATRQRMDALSADQKRAVEKHAASMSEAKRKEEAAKFERAAGIMLSAKNPQEWDALAQQYGQPELVGKFAQREQLAARFMSIKDILAMNEGPKPADEYGRYVQEERAAGREPMSRIEFKRAGQKTTRIRTTPDGGTEIVEGFGNANTPPKLTVDAGKNTGFYIRTQAANEVLNSLEAQGTDFWQQAADAAPFGLGNYARTPEFQKFDQARRDFVNAVLRRESGAVISEQEFDNANKQYFPVPGDGPEVIAQKRKNRETAIEGLRIGSGEGANYADQNKPQAQPMTFEQFSSDPSAKAAAEKYGVTLEEMWQLKQESK